jgi:NOL1/NOP2/fmu family ribosome biogenesis protein
VAAGRRQDRLAQRPVGPGETGHSDNEKRLGPVSLCLSDTGQADRALSSLARAVRLWPHLAPGEGHFVALLRKRDAPFEKLATLRPQRSARLLKDAERAYLAFCADNLVGVPATERLALVGSYLYALPPDLPDLSGRSLSGLRVIHPGWWLGTVKGDRFEPGHALALALRSTDARSVVDLPADSHELMAYIRGQVFRRPGKNGWVLVTVDGFPIGWGRRVGDVVKSKYPKGLRWVS